MDSPTWHVLGDQISQTSTLKPGGGGIITIYEVPYMIDSGPAIGHVGRVEVAANVFNEATVKEAVQQAVNAVHSVAGVKS